MDTLATRHQFVRIKGLSAEPLEWLWPDSVGLGNLTLFFGDPGLGKSFLTVDLAARVSSGRPWPNCPEQPSLPGDVVLLNGEDDARTTVRPRLEAAGADLDRIITLQPGRADQPLAAAPFALDRDMASLWQAVGELPNCRLVIIDPISMFLGRTNAHLNAEIRSLLSPLADLAARKRVAVVVVSHLNKTVGRKALYRAIGSVAFVAAARSAKLVLADPADASRRLFLSVKNNLTLASKGLGFRLTSPPGGVAHVEWEPDEVTYTPDEALAPPIAKPPAHSNELVVEWLSGMVARLPVPAQEILDKGKEMGFSVDQIFRASKVIGVQKFKLGFGNGWHWTLPDE